MISTRHWRGYAAVASILAVAPCLSAESTVVEELVVRGSRLPASLQTMPQSVDILEAADIATQAAVTSDMQSILANLIPGLSRSSNTTVSTYLSLRGRKPVILVDGIPVTSTLNDTGREVNLIDPMNIERIEVVRGSSALYGQSAGAGFINYITKSGTPGPISLRTEVGGEVSLTRISSDSLSPAVRSVLFGGEGGVDYRVGGYYKEVNSLYDAKGDRLPPPTGNAINDSSIKSGYGKVGYTFDNQRIEAAATYYKQESEFKYAIVNGNIGERIAARAIQADPQAAEVPQYNENFTANLVYANSSVLGSATTLRTQVFYDESYSIFQYVRNRFPRAVALGQSPDAQSANDTRKFGARVDVNTPLIAFTPFGGELLWGVDYLHDDTRIPLVDGREFGIPQQLESYAGFFELQFRPLDPLSVTLGARREELRLDVKDFLSLFTLARITGGELSYSTTALNAGLVYTINPTVDVFAGFSQGFDIQQTSQNFRAWPNDINLAQTQPPANVIDSYETGVRLHGNGFEASASVFLTQSSDGVSYVFNAATPRDPTPMTAPDHVWGVELKADYTGIDDWRFGASYAQMEGSSDNDNDGRYETWLQGRRIPPPSVNAYAQWEFAPGSSLRVQALYSGDRNRFPNAAPGAFHSGAVHSYFIADLAARFDLGSYGELNVGLSNLFNRDYWSNYSEAFNTNDNYIKAPGRTSSLRYAVSF